MDYSLSDTLKFGISIFSVLNPLGAIPVFLTLTKNNSDLEIKKISTTCAFTIFITITIGLLFGGQILHFFGISIASFRIGGGILLATMAFNMLSAKQHNLKINQDEIEAKSDVDEVGIVPLAIPLIAGPGSISTSIIASEKFNSFAQYAACIIVVVIISFSIKYILRSSRTIGVKMGTVGLNVMTRIMGLILMALAIEFISGGVKQIFPFLAQGQF
ncbi:MAG: MarC family protein [Bacteriovoracaceae bacterium]